MAVNRLARCGGMIGIVGLVFALVQAPMVEIVADLIRPGPSAVYLLLFGLATRILVLGPLGIDLVARDGIRRP